MAKIPVIVLLALMVLTEYLDAQSAVVPIGTDMESQTGTISYTVGQVAYQTFTSQAGSINEGVQQVFKDTILNTFDADSGLNPAFSIYPNPVDGMLTIGKSGHSTMRFTYMLYSPELKLVRSGNLDAMYVRIETEGIMPGVSYLVILRDGIIYTQFKIVIIK